MPNTVAGNEQQLSPQRPPVEERIDACMALLGNLRAQVAVLREVVTAHAHGADGSAVMPCSMVASVRAPTGGTACSSPCGPT